MIKEDVDAEEIADVVSKWTGIPVNKMLEGEKNEITSFRRRIKEKSDWSKRSY